ncbi:MAG: hypothetical protein II854_00995 [Prevotella sp.]|nr:hypothetical protein [Prevotella sp.]
MKRIALTIVLTVLMLASASAARLEGAQACSVEEAKSKAPKKVKKKKTVTMRGYIQDGSRKYHLTMRLTFKGNAVYGSYYYNKYGPKHCLELSGSFTEDGKLLILEGFMGDDDNGYQTGQFLGDLTDNTYSGEFMDVYVRRMSFYLTY